MNAGTSGLKKQSVIFHANNNIEIILRVALFGTLSYFFFFINIETTSCKLQAYGLIDNVSPSLGHVLLQSVSAIPEMRLAEFLVAQTVLYLISFFSNVYDFHLEKIRIDRSAELVNMEFLASLFIPLMINQKLPTADILFNF